MGSVCVSVNSNKSNKKVFGVKKKPPFKGIYLRKNFMPSELPVFLPKITVLN